MKRNLRNQNNGITLIALVVTIVVLIIIASISIGALTGDGIINQAKKGKDSAEISEEKEIINISVTQAIDDDVMGNLEKSKLQEKLNSNTANGITEVIDNGDTLVVKFTEKNRYYEVSKNGNTDGPKDFIEDENGGDLSKGGSADGSEEKPFQINCIEDLVEFSIMVNGGNQFQTQYVVLMRTLDFKSIFSYNDYTTTKYGDLNTDGIVEDIKTELTKTAEGCIGFTPIGGGSKDFQGIFDGQGFSIKNIYENENSWAGLFGQTTDATIQNLAITGNISSAGYVGGIVQYASGTTQIINCHNEVIINAGDGNTIYQGTGGICGSLRYGGIISNCYNTGNITGNAVEGGIAGYLEGKIENCYNSGNITSKSTKTYKGAGGIVGRTSNATSMIIGCYNMKNGKITGSKSGGIIGEISSSGSGTSNLKIINCYNLGIIAGERSGGIVGICSSDSVGSITNTQISNCYNLGNIVDGLFLGGIVGEVWQVYGTLNFYMNNLINIGKVSQNATYKGEIIGRKVAATVAEANNCYYYLGNTNKAVGLGTVTGTINSSDIDENLIITLNEFVTNYNETNKNEEEFIELKQWKMDEDKILF